MKRVYIFTLIAILAVVGSLGGAYQFYFKAKIEEYRSHQLRKANLEKKLEEMAREFSGVKPEKLVQEWKLQVNPWYNAVADEGSNFKLGVDEVPPVPAEVVSPRLYYKDEYQKMMLAILQEAYPRQIPATNFGVPTPDGIPNNTATPQEVRQWLQRLQFGQDMIRLLLNHNAHRIDNIAVWPDAHKQDGLLMKRTVGAQFVMSLPDLVDFLETLRTSDQYYNVEALRISNPYLLTSPPPPVTVEILFTVGWFNRDKLETATATTSAASFSNASDALSNFGIRARLEAKAAQTSGFTRWWRNFRKRYLPF